MQKVSVIDFTLVENHPYIKALANLSFSGLVLRGLRLEEKSGGGLTLGYPGRKIQGSWQVLFESGDPRTHRELLETMNSRYETEKEAA